MEQSCCATWSKQEPNPWGIAVAISQMARHVNTAPHWLSRQRCRRHFFNGIKPSKSHAFWRWPKTRMFMFTCSSPLLYLSMALSIFPILSCWRLSSYTVWFPVLYVCMHGMFKHACVNAHVKLYDRSTSNMHTHIHTYIHTYAHTCMNLNIEKQTSQS